MFNPILDYIYIFPPPKKYLCTCQNRLAVPQGHKTLKITTKSAAMHDGECADNDPISFPICGGHSRKRFCERRRSAWPMEQDQGGLIIHWLVASVPQTCVASFSYQVRYTWHVLLQYIKPTKFAEYSLPVISNIWVNADRQAKYYAPFWQV